jgi:hypothetical protein
MTDQERPRTGDDEGIDPGAPTEPIQVIYSGLPHTESPRGAGEEGTTSVPGSER